MATLASGYPLRENNGSLTLFVWKFSSIATSDTYATGITGGMFSAPWMVITSGLAVATTGGNWQLSEATGTITFTQSGAPGTSIAATVYGYAKL